jgi:uncharacterized protein
MNMKMLHMVAFVLVVIGGLNWGLVGLFNGFNLVHALLGFSMMLENLVYVLVGLSAVWLAYDHKASCRYCGTGKK